MFDLSTDPLFWLARLPVIFFALTVHEFAHAWMAVRCGDGTPEEQGRVTLNPVAHLDPIGTFMIIFGPIGWGRPVMVNPMNFRNQRRDELLVSAAGPASNIIQAGIFSLAFPFIVFGFAYFDKLDDPLLSFLTSVCQLGILINLSLAIFNMIPLFPLDGEKVLVQILPRMQAMKVVAFRQKSTFVLMGLIFMGFVIGFSPIVIWIQFFMKPFLIAADYTYTVVFGVLQMLL